MPRNVEFDWPRLAGTYAYSLAIIPLNPLIIYAGNESGGYDAF